jgi:hypothetical protein
MNFLTFLTKESDNRELLVSKNIDNNNISLFYLTDSQTYHVSIKRGRYSEQKSFRLKKNAYKYFLHTIDLVKFTIR